MRSRANAESGPAAAVSHAAFVDAWLAHAAAQRMPREALLDLFESALIVLWARTGTILGVVTLAAIADRVLHQAGEQFPVLASIEVEPNGRVQARVQRRNIDAIPPRQLHEGIRSVLVEFLTVVGNLTAEILTDELRSDLTALPTNGARPPRTGRKGTA